MRCPSLLLVCSFALACGGGTPVREGPKIGRTQSNHTAPIAELPVEFRGQVPALQDSAVLGMLPDNIMAAIIGKSPSHLATSLEAVAILREYPEFFAEANVALNASKSASLLVPSTWSNIGIDVDAPFGAAFVVHKRAVGLFFASLSDTEMFRSNVAFAAEVLGLGKVHQSSIGERHIIRFQNEDEVAILVNAKSAVLIIADRTADIELVLADMLGTSDTQTLAQSGRIAKSFTGFDYGEDVTGFVVFDTFAARLAEDRNRRSGDNYWLGQLDELEKRVEEAKSQAKPQAEIDELEAKLANVLDKYNGVAMREAAEAHFTDTMMGTLGTVAFGLDLGEARTGIRVRITAAPESLANRLFLSGGGPLKSPKRLQEEPLWMLAGHVDRIAALEVFKTIINMEGETLGGLAGVARDELQVDLNAWLDLLGGEMSGAFTLNRDILLSARNSDETLDAFGMHVMLEVRDEAAARELLLKAMQSPALKQFVSGKGESAVLEIESFNNRPIRITLADGFIEARSVGPKPSTSPWKKHETLRTGSAQNLAMLVFDPMLMQWLMFSDNYDSYEARAASASMAAKPNPETEAKIAELSKQIEALRDKQGALRNALFIKGSDSFGRLVVTARREPSGSLAILGSLVGTASNVGRGLQAVVESMEMDLQEVRTGKPSPLRQVEVELRTLQSERSKLWNSRY